MSDDIAAFMSRRLERAETALMQRRSDTAAALPERERRDSMKAMGMYPGPAHDPSYYEDPKAWWERYEAANPIPGEVR